MPPRGLHQRVEHDEHLVVPVVAIILEEDGAAAAVKDVVPVGARVEGGEEEVAAADGGGEVPVPEADGGEAGEAGMLVPAGRVEEEADQGRRRVEGAELAAEVGGGGHDAAPGTAGAGSADERGERGHAKEDL